MYRLLWAIAAVTASSNLAFAADLRPAKNAPAAPAAVVATVYNWTGPYIGAHCGGAWGHTTTDNLSPFDDTGENFKDSLNPSGWLCGAQLGYNWQFTNWLVGLEGDLGYLGLKKNIVTPASGGNDDPHGTQVKYNSWYGTATARLGLTFDRWLAYAKGGAAFAHITNTVGDLSGGNFTSEDFSQSKGTRTGWTIGGGVEYAYAQNWTAKLEYLYMDFGSKTSTNSDGFDFEHKNQVHTVKVGLNYKP